MAKIFEPTDEQVAGYAAWVETRPSPVLEIARRLDPWTLYKMEPNGERVTLEAISEDGTVRVRVSAKHNMLVFERSVFGVNPDNLSPCELPTDDEPVGALLTDRGDVDAFIDAVRPVVLAGRQDD